MCGIIGTVVSTPSSTLSYLLEPLQQLEYRGYDSCGFFSLSGDKSHHVRRVGPVESLRESVESCKESNTFSLGIAHTRWATHGKVSAENSHPQASGERIYVVHNGVIDNHQEVKANLILKGYVFESETDTEVISHLIHFYVSGLTAAYSMSTAVCMALMDLRGKFSFIALDKETKSMIMVNHGRPLIAFRDDNSLTIASDVTAFSGKQRGVIYYLQDKEVCEVNENIQKLRRIRLVGGSRTQEKIMTEFLPYTPEVKESYANMRTLMETEIYQQPTSVEATLNSQPVAELKQLFSSILSSPETVKRVKLIGCGTSYHAAQLGAWWLKFLSGVEASAHVSTEFSNQTDVDTTTDIFIFISQSGETADTLSALAHVNQYAPSKTVAICNVAQSELVRNSRFVILTRGGAERSVASTKSFSCQLTALLKVAIALGTLTQRGAGSVTFIIESIERELAQLPSLLQATLDAVREPVKALAAQLRSPKQAIFLARGILHPVALEGALKLIEVAYVPSLTYFTGELKHGPLALVDEETPVFVTFSAKEPNLSNMFSSLSQVQARGGKLALFSDESGLKLAEQVGLTFTSVAVPQVNRYNYIFDPILSIIPLQLIAHEVALSLGRNVDRPRNLAKSITIE